MGRAVLSCILEADDLTLVGAVFLAIPRYRTPYHPYLFILAGSVVLRRHELP